MLRKFILILFIFIGLSVQASDNFLNAIVFEKNDENLSIRLRSDSVAKIHKDVESLDKVLITLKGVQQSPDINTIYKNITNVDGLAIQKENNDLKIFIEAPNIARADIVFETPDSAPITASDSASEGKVIWSIISVILLLFVMYSAKNVNIEHKQKDINEIIKERELALYRNFQKEVATLPSMNYKLKCYRKHVLKGETIRSYESRMSKI